MVIINITILGSTGSIGTQTIEVCKENGINIKAIAGNNNAKLLGEQARNLNVDMVCICNEDKYDQLKSILADTNIKIICGNDGLIQIAEMDNIDIMVNSVVGMVGLLPTLKAIEKGTDIALANKETLVAGGELVMPLARENNVKIYPIDSEHSAIFQCLQGNKREQVKGIILTASGGPFFQKNKDDLRKVTLSDALNHPNWSMGNKITIDSATLMNKGLEFIEAKWLFDLTPEQIEIVVHRESVIHSAVEYMDNSVIAQLGVPDMKIPIQYALLYPDRKPCDVKRLSLIDYGALTFFKPDFETFQCLKTAIDAIKIGGTAPAIINGANEMAVNLFLNGKIEFLTIGEIVRDALKHLPNKIIKCYDDVLEADISAREFVLANLKNCHN